MSTAEAQINHQKGSLVDAPFALFEALASLGLAQAHVAATS